MDKDILYNKMGIIERCLIRVKEVYDQDPCNLKDYTKQDSIVLNLQRAVEATIDIAMYLVSIKKLGIPQNSRDAFEVLNQHNIIEDEMLNKMKSMIGFRNIAVHNYQNLNLEVLQKVIENHLEDFVRFVNAINEKITK